MEKKKEVKTRRRFSSSAPGGAGHGGTGSRPNQNSGKTYGDGKITSLIGGSGGGGFIVDAAGGSGGGAIAIDANDSLIIDTAILAVGGNGSGGSAGGSGGAIKLSANHLFLTENSFLDVSVEQMVEQVVASFWAVELL